MNQQELLERLELKINQLLLKLQQVDNMNETLILENQQLQIELLERNKYIAQLQEKINTGLKTNEHRKKEEILKATELKKQLEQSVHQLNECIEWLSKL